jgi:hypothetical protein
VQYLQKNSVTKLNDQQFAVASHAITQTFQFAPKSGIHRVRLAVRDAMSGRIGSVDIPYQEAGPPGSAAAPVVPAPAKP